MEEKALKIPEHNSDVKEIIRKQIALLAEESEKYKGEPELVVALSEAMDKIAGTLFVC